MVGAMSISCCLPTCKDMQAKLLVVIGAYVLIEGEARQTLQVEFVIYPEGLKNIAQLNRLQVVVSYLNEE